MSLTQTFSRCFFTIVLLGACGASGCGSPTDTEERDPVDRNQGGGGGPYVSNNSECTTSADCTDGKVCDELNGCVECLFDSQCGQGERCVERQCLELVTCAVDEDCAGGAQPVCGAQEFCVACEVDEHCAEGKRCLDTSCVEATPCVNSRDCGSAEVCDRMSGWCVECLGDADCGEAFTCVGNSCEARCASDKECAEQRFLCDTSSSHCVECLENVDCPAAYHCSEGKCAVDVCQESDARCEEATNTLYACNEEGSGMVPLLCPTGTTCGEVEGVAACEPWICEPGSTVCDAENEKIRFCELDGLNVVETDCTEMDGVCEGGACVDVVCKAGEYSCIGGNSYLCGALGTQLGVNKTCSALEYCDDETGLCTPTVCSKGQDTCVGTEVRTCNAEGSGYESEITDCADTDQICYNAECRDKICEDGVRHCYGGDVYSCSQAGTYRNIYDDCYSSEYCDDSGTFAVCRAKVCTPDSTYCQGDILGTCNDEGSGMEETGTTDCSLDGNICYQGACKPVICAGSYGCSEGHVHYCSSAGTAYGSRRDTCFSSEHCVEGVSSCKSDVCTQGAAACDGNRATTCNADGSGYDPGGTECEEGYACVTGSCLEIICDPYSYFCEGGNVYYCGSTGTTSTLQDTCTGAEYCAEGVAYCRADVCTAGEPTCSGSNLSTCAEDGSGPKDEGTACEEGYTCDDGSCAAVICTPSEYRCSDNNGQRCSSEGTVWEPYRNCSEPYYCDSAGDYPVCQLDFCAPGTAACNGETIAMCGDDGGSYTSESTDCSLTNQVCNGTACADTDVFEIASADVSVTTSSYTYLNKVTFTSDRTLTEIEQYFEDVTGTYQFTFYVFEATAYNNFHSKIFEKIITASPDAEFVTSGEISVPLVAGKSYAIGVRIAGNHTTYYSEITVPTHHHVGSYYGAIGTAAAPGASVYGALARQYYQRLTFEEAAP